MRKFQVTVNGNSYEVEVEELAGGVSSAPVMSTPTTKPAAPVAKPAAPKPAVAAPAGPAGMTKIVAPMQGKIVGIKATAGQEIKKGQVVCVLEAMKMENEILAAKDGVIATVNVTVGQNVQSGDLLASMN